LGYRVNRGVFRDRYRHSSHSLLCRKTYRVSYLTPPRTDNYALSRSVPDTW